MAESPQNASTASETMDRDFNFPSIDWSLWASIKEDGSELNFIETSLFQHILEPTRYSNDQEPSLLDLVLTFKEALLEISRILNAGLDSETMAICLRLCDSGVNPEALAFIIKELRKETAAFRAAETFSQTS